MLINDNEFGDLEQLWVAMGYVSALSNTTIGRLAALGANGNFLSWGAAENGKRNDDCSGATGADRLPLSF